MLPANTVCNEKSMKFYWLTLGVLGVWRVTHLLQAEDGPADLIVRLRAALGHSVFGRVMDCFLCLSVWTALPFALWCGETWKERALLWPAFSAGAIMLQLWSRDDTPSPMEVGDECMLREEAGNGINSGKPPSD
jgi:hypothetical protein